MRILQVIITTKVPYHTLNLLKVRLEEKGFKVFLVLETENNLNISYLEELALREEDACTKAILSKKSSIIIYYRNSELKNTQNKLFDENMVLQENDLYTMQREILLHFDLPFPIFSKKYFIKVNTANIDNSLITFSDENNDKICFFYKNQYFTIENGNKKFQTLRIELTNKSNPNLYIPNWITFFSEIK